MTDPIEKETSGKPDDRALSAMAEAARRARELTHGTEERTDGLAADAPRAEQARFRWGGRRVGARPHPEGGPVPEGGVPRPGPQTGPPVGERWRLGERVLEASVVIVGALVLGLGSAVVTLGLSGHTVSPSATTRASQAQQAQHRSSAANGPAAGRASARNSNGAAGRTGPAHPPSGTAGQQAASGSTPELLSLSPAGGHAGQVVTVSGVNLFSADGVVQALVGGEAAPTSCPTQTACTVTVPAGMGAPGTLPLMIETEAGISNALSFSYG